MTDKMKPILLVFCAICPPLYNMLLGNGQSSQIVEESMFIFYSEK